MCQNQEGGSGGAHGNRQYDGFSEEQHDKDVSGNNAAIEQLEQELAEKEATQNSKEDDS